MKFSLIRFALFAVPLVAGCGGSQGEPILDAGAGAGNMVAADGSVPSGTGGSGGTTGSGGSGGSGGSTASGGTTGGGSTASGGTTGSGGGVSDGGVDVVATVDVTPAGPDLAIEVRPETAMDVGRSDTAASPFCPAKFRFDELPAIPPADFCAQFGKTCSFQAGIHYSSMADCLAKYGALPTSVQACRSVGLCYAVNNTDTYFCVRASGYNWPGCGAP